MDSSFGFAEKVTGGSGAPVTVVHNANELRTALASSGDPLGRAVIEIAAGSYDFGANGAQLAVEPSAVTIRTQQNVNSPLQNVSLRFDLTRPVNVIVDNVTFRSNGKEATARDAIKLESEVPEPGEPPTPGTSRIRITRCSFEGYYDIAIDGQSITGRPPLLLTIDHCYFFDDHPGEKGEGNARFFNRGAINIAGSPDPPAGKPKILGRSFVTVANNVFQNVWRRSPRVADGNLGHVYNNLLYLWGITTPIPPSTNGTWRGSEVGGGSTPLDTDDGSALLQANRYIPWQPKMQPDMTINIHKLTRVDLGDRSDATPADRRPNRFDDSTGRELTSGTPTVPPANAALLTLTDIYRRANDGLTLPSVTLKGNVNWTTILNESGPAGSAGADPPATTRRQQLRMFLQTAP